MKDGTTYATLSSLEEGSIKKLKINKWLHNPPRLLLVSASAMVEKFYPGTTLCTLDSIILLFLEVQSNHIVY